MQAKFTVGQLSSTAERGRALYESNLKAMLETEHRGEAVAIHVDNDDYAIGASHSGAARALLARHEADGRIVTLTIGAPTGTDIRLATRIAACTKR